VEEERTLIGPEKACKREGRHFETGAYRDGEEDKFDYHGFLSPVVLEAYARYMHKHRLQSNGELRASDNWKRGIPREVYIESLLRHVMALWLWHDGLADPSMDTAEDALGGILFNTMGYYHELIEGN
jgi:hypothetical protein